MLFVIICILLGAYLAGNVVSQAIRLYAMGIPLFPGPLETAESPLARVASVGREVAISTFLRFLWPLGLLPQRLPRSVEKSLHPPVIVIHGMSMNHTSMFPLQWWLRQKGWTTLSFDWSGGNLSLELAAHHLAQRIQLLQQITGVTQFDLVCHSAGGLIARYFVECLAGGPSVRKLITLGTPHQGARMALFGWGLVSRDLLPGSPFLARLGMVKGIDYTSLAGEMDSIVFPPASTRLGPPCQDITLPGLGHNTLLAHAAAFQQIREALLRENLAIQEASP